jgi:hypothetical protein
MDVKELIRFSVNRYKVIEKIETLEKENSTLETRWIQLNAIRRMANELNLYPQEDADTAKVRERWHTIRQNFANK